MSKEAITSRKQNKQDIDKFNHSLKGKIVHKVTSF